MDPELICDPPDRAHRAGRAPAGLDRHPGRPAHAARADPALPLLGAVDPHRETRLAPVRWSGPAFIAGLTRGVALAGTGVMFIVRVLVRGTRNTMQDRHEGDAEQVLDA